ncbi:Hypothetical predicted protein [Drosophila guanche]|uniref:Uncharacterized protein n=1 Tax=Drosophila guanche TaxID=7266 RepID=A0A3B0J3A9_DROGU|nr:Hypothetical predicted protein [Drosophila guanche]
MAGTTILASICAGRLTKFIVQHSKGQTQPMQHKARLAGQLLDPQQKTAEGFGYLKRYAASQQPKVMKYDLTSQWTSSMEKQQPNSTTKIRYPGQKSAQMSPTLLMGIHYALGLGSADNCRRQPQPMAIDRFKLYRNCF